MYSDNTVLEKIWDIFRSSDTEVVAAGINYLDDKGKVGSRSWTPVSPSNIDFENGCAHLSVSNSPERCSFSRLSKPPIVVPSIKTCGKVFIPLRC